VKAVTCKVPQAPTSRWDSTQRKEIVSIICYVILTGTFEEVHFEEEEAWGRE